jgi:hypothetical protein
MKKLAILIFCLCITLCNSCTTTKRKNYIILLDNSTSISKELFDKYIAVLQKNILYHLGPQDRLTIIFVDESSQIRAERIFFIDMAQTNFTNKNDGINNEADSNKQRMTHFINDSLIKNVNQIVFQKRIERQDCGQFTDILSALQEATNLIKNKASFKTKTDQALNDASGTDNYEYENCIVLFSDMVNENALKTFDFRPFAGYTAQQVDEKFEAISKANMVAELSNCKVIVYGATATKEAGANANTQIEHIRTLWKQYFKSAGAQLIGYGYDTGNEILEYANEQ